MQEVLGRSVRKAGREFLNTLAGTDILVQLEAPRLEDEDREPEEFVK